MEKMKDNNVRRVVFEVSLKPFKNRNFNNICEDILDKWSSMINIADSVSILLWVGNGSEIVLWDGNFNKEINWARYIGFCNYDFKAYPKDIPPENDWYLVNKAILYTDKPLKITYKDLKEIIKCFKKICKEKYKKKLTVGIPFDPGPEFVHDQFRYLKHPEILAGGPNSEYNTCWFVCSFSEIKNVKEKLKGFPKGIKGSIPFGEFLGKQFYHFAKDLNVDYIWFSNGFAFSHYAWYYKGEIFDGEKFRIEKIPDIEEKIISFWKYFRKYWKGKIEVRGTNYAMGLDISKDAINYKRIYKEGKLDIIPPNTPWGSRDMGGEICIYLTRLAEIPGEKIPIRFYINDPWFRVNAWTDYYGRQPYDIYLPMMTGRINEKGKFQKFTDIEFLTIDTEKGEVFKEQGEEVYYHIKRGLEFSSDEAGPILWIYPYDEYHETLKNPTYISHLYFGDSFISRSITNGFPLNTVISSKNFKKLYRKNPDYFKDKILLTHLPVSKWEYIYDVIDFVKDGGNAIFYGSFEPVSEDIRKIFNVRVEDEGLYGDFEIENLLFEDELNVPLKRKFYHNPVFGGGGLKEILEEGEKVRLIKNGKRRSFVGVINYGKGKIGWIRGSLPFLTEKLSLHPLTLSPINYYEPGDFSRYLLSEFGYFIKFKKYVDLGKEEKRDSLSEIKVSVISPSISNSPTILIGRNKNGFVIGGLKPSSEVEIFIRFPEGIPVLTEREVVVDNKIGKYILDKTFLFEVRVLVEQDLFSVIKAREVSKDFGYKRQIHLSGLKNSTLTIYPENLEKCKIKVMDRLIPKFLEIEKCKNYVKKGGLNGEIEILW